MVDGRVWHPWPRTPLLPVGTAWGQHSKPAPPTLCFCGRRYPPAPTRGSAAWSRRRRCMQQVLHHRTKVVHRALTPARVLVRPGSQSRVTPAIRARLDFHPRQPSKFETAKQRRGRLWNRRSSGTLPCGRAGGAGGRAGGRNGGAGRNNTRAPERPGGVGGWGAAAAAALLARTPAASGADGCGQGARRRGRCLAGGKLRPASPRRTAAYVAAYVTARPAPARAFCKRSACGGAG